MITQKQSGQIWILLAETFSTAGLGIVVALLVRWQIDFCRLIIDAQSSCTYLSSDNISHCAIKTFFKLIYQIFGLF